MKSILEHIVDDKFEKYLMEDLRLLLDCSLSNFDHFFEGFNYPRIFESIELFDNHEIILNIISNELHKVPNDFENGKQIIVKINAVQKYPKKVYFKLYNTKDGYSAACDYVNKNGEVFIELVVDNTFKYNFNRIRILILHELIHGYEEFIRISNDKESIFDEITQEYKNAFKKLKSDDFVEKYIAYLKYFFDDREKATYQLQLETEIEDIFDRIKPSYRNLKFDKILSILKQEYIWKRYFEFGKFVLFIDEIPDDVLIDKYKNITEKDKTPEEIRKECKDKWKEFKSEFDIKFIEAYDKALTNNSKYIL